MASSINPPFLWIIGGSDSSGGAGIQADLKTASAFGIHAGTVITAVTAQSSESGVQAQILPNDSLLNQIESLRHDLPPQVIKLGMLGDISVIEELERALFKTPAFVICDPVLSTSTGAPLLTEAGLKKLRQALFPRVDLLTPNLIEAERLTERKLSDSATPEEFSHHIERMAKDLLKTGIKAVLIKGGHRNQRVNLHQNAVYPSQDFYTNGQVSAWITSPRFPKLNPRGTGCTLATAIGAAISQGYPELDAIVIGKMYINQCFRLLEMWGPNLQTRYSKPAFLSHQKPDPISKDLPWLTPSAQEGVDRTQNLDRLFPDCGSEPLGFYPIVDRLSWLKRLLPLGVKTAQLRIKDLSGNRLEREIQESIRYARQFGCRLFINDYWELAIREGAYGVHLGQEDLETADLNSLLQARLRLGVSTHCYSEVARAHAIGPSYAAIGPIFHTTLKALKFAPQGIAALQHWKKVVNYPLVAIGGISLKVAQELRQAGADGIAVVSDITKNPSPEDRTKAWLVQF